MTTMTITRRPKRLRRYGSTAMYQSRAHRDRARLTAADVAREIVAGVAFSLALAVIIAAVYIGGALIFL